MRLKRSFFLLMSTILFLSSSLFSQAYNLPESVAYDGINDLYWISNTGTPTAANEGNLNTVKPDDTANIVDTISGIASSIRGIARYESALIAATTNVSGNAEVVIFIELTTKTVYKEITITEGDFINDVAISSDGSKIYVSDNNNIYEIDVNTSTYTVLLANAGANGLLYDGTNNRLIFTDDRQINDSAISAIDLNTKNVTTLITNTNFQWLDGLTVDQHGNFYVTCWSDPNSIYKYDPTFTTVNKLPYFNDNGAGYADIYYDQTNDILVVPEMNNNAVQFVQPNNLVKTEKEEGLPTGIQLNQNFPNPFNPSTTINYEIISEGLVNITVYDLLGSEVVRLVNQVEQPGNRSVRWDGRDQQGNIVNGGVYVYRLTIGNHTETKKMVFLK